MPIGFPSTPRSRRRTLAIVLAGAGGCWTVAVAGIYGFEWARLRLEPAARVGDGPVDPLRKFAMPGVVRPPAVDAGASGLVDDEPVIGVEVSGRARAYRLGALRDRSSHVVNDLVGEVPVTVSYCDLSDCVKGFTGPSGQGPLDVAVGGLYRGREMILESGGRLYFQESGAAASPEPGPSSIPLNSLAPERTTWGEWKRRHPSTDVVEGFRPQREAPADR